MDNVKRRIIRKEQAFSMIFAIYLYIFISISTMTNKNSVGYISGDLHLVMYYVDQLVFVAGIFFNAFFWGRLKKDEHKSMYLKVLAVLFYLEAFMIILYPGAFSFLVLAPMVHFFLGALGGAVYYFVASALLETGLVGRIIASGAAVAYLLQYFVQILSDSKLLLLIFIIMGGITLIPIFKNSWKWIILECLPAKDTEEKKILSGKWNQLITTIILSIAAVVLLSYCDSWLIHKMVETEFQAVSAYSWPRLFAILGYVLVGAIGDYREGRYVNITLFSAILWLIICPALLSDNDSMMLIMVIFYIVVGVYMGYMYFKFFTLSPYFGKNGILYASLGRIIEGTAGVLFSLLPWNGMKTWHIIAIGIMSVTIMAAAIVRDYVTAKESGKTMDAGEGANADVIGESPEDADTAAKDISEAVEAIEECPSEVGDNDQNLGQESEETISEDEDSETSDVPYLDTELRKQVLAGIAKEYEFTSREQEVFEKLIFTEDSGQEIADELFISRRVLQRHVAAIYEKTGTKSRVGLFRIYHKASLER